MSDLLFGIDLGGTKIEGIVIDQNNPEKALVRTRIPTESERGYDHILSQISALLASLEKSVNAKSSALGIATPGCLDPELKTMKNCNTTVLNGKPFGIDLKNKLNREVKLANDANCFALAEATLGAARDASIVFGVIMGTGVGGGIVINGKVWFGKHGIAGEWGHTILNPDGPICYCGRKGCVETFISGPAIEDYYRSISGERTTLSEIVERNDTFGQLAIARLCHNFGLALADVINVLDPDVIVLGGGLSNIDALYKEGYEAVKENVFNHALTTKIVRNSLGDSAGVYGAALLVQ